MDSILQSISMRLINIIHKWNEYGKDIQVKTDNINKNIVNDSEGKYWDILYEIQNILR